MPKGRPRKVISLDDQIKAQETAVAEAKARYEEIQVSAKAKYDEALSKAQAAYDAAVSKAESRYTDAQEKLNELNAEKKEQLKSAVLDAIMASGKSLDEIMELIGSAPEKEDTEEVRI